MSHAIKSPASPLEVVASLDDYAIVMAHLSRFRDQGHVLASLEVSPDAWQAAQAWCARMGDEALHGRRVLTDRFIAKFNAVLDALPDVSPLGVQPTGDKPRPGPAASGPTFPELSAQAVSDAAVVRPLERLGAGGAVVAPSVAAASRIPTVEVGFVAPRRVLPFDPHATPMLPLSHEGAPESSKTEPEDPLERTLSVELLRPEGATLPFARPPLLSVEQYASMRASLEVFPEKRSVILARYRLADDAQLAAVQRAFEGMFERDVAARRAYSVRFDDLISRLKGEL